MYKDLINNIDLYVEEINTIIKTNNVSKYFIHTILGGISKIISTINTIAKYNDSTEADLALEKLYNLVTILEIKFDECEE